MRAATKILVPIFAVAALSGCGETESAEQNVVITNSVPAGADVEALPADESSGTSSDDLANGAVTPDENGAVNASDNLTDGY